MRASILLVVAAFGAALPAAAADRFTNPFSTNSICTPSRATLLTGQYSHTNGVPVFNRFDGSVDHVAKQLQAAGYHTGMIGTWHLGGDPTGFDRWIVLPAPDTLRDACATRPAALPENRQTIARDLIRKDLKQEPPPGLRVPLIARGPGITAGVTPGQLVANIDVAPTFLDLAGVAIPPSMQGRSLVPLLRNEQPADWRTSVSNSYCHDPGDHDTRAHYGVRTATHKLIHYRTKDAWEMYDLASDPHELHNRLFDPAEAARPEVAERFAALKAEIARLQKEYADDGRFADLKTLPLDDVPGDSAGKEPLGTRTVAKAIAASVAR